MNKAKETRNKELVKAYLRLKEEGRPMISLVKKFNITTQRIYYILKREGVDISRD